MVEQCPEAEAAPHFRYLLRESLKGRLATKGRCDIGGGLSELPPRRAGGRRSVQPPTAHLQLGTSDPCSMFFATPRCESGPGQLSFATTLTTEHVIAHVQRVALSTLEGKSV